MTVTPRAYCYAEFGCPYFRRSFGNKPHTAVVGGSFWIGRLGEKFGARGIEGTIRRASEAKLGKVFGTHCFRHSLATTLADIDPTTPGVAVSILGTSEGVVKEHYNKARDHDAFRHFQADTQVARLSDKLNLGGLTTTISSTTC